MHIPDPDPILFRHRYRVPSTRLKDWDYANAGSYFVTICTEGREHWFGQINNKMISLSVVGIVIDECWQKIPHHFPHVSLDRYVVMPNHVHGIITLGDRAHDGMPVGGETPCRDVSTGRHAWHRAEWQPGCLGVVINNFKAACTHRVRKINPDFGWQPRFHDHVIRTESELMRIRRYIENNPLEW